MVYAAVLLFIVTLVFVIWQPRGLAIGWSATVGAVVALLLRIVTIRDVLEVTKIVWDATFAFVGIIIFSTILDKIGFFEWAALKMAHMANGDGRKVFLYIIFLGAVVSAFFANDGAALILTPIVLEKMKLLKFEQRKMIPFIVSSGFIADTTSVPFVISNLVNIVSADYFHVGFVSYAWHMIVPNLVSLCASTLLLYLFFRKDIPESYNPGDLPDPREAIVHKGMFHISWLILAVLVIGYIFTELLHIPVSFVAGSVAMLFLIAGQRTKVIQPWRILREAPWSIVIFSIGMYVVVYGLKNAGLTDALGRWIQCSTESGLFTGTLATGFIAGVVSSVMNNLPTVMIDALAIHSTHTSGIMREALVYANVIGCDLGPKMTPVGSLSTLLWLYVLGKKGIRISWGEYVKSGIVLTVPTLFITLCGFYAWLIFIH